MKKLLVITGLLIVSMPMVLWAQKKQSKPNVILIVADDLGYGDVGCYGQQKIKTPNIDALAKHGMRFTQFYAGTAVCAPSRASLLTGMHTGHTPVRGNKGMKPEGQFPLPDSSVTILQVLKENGYTTGAFGKWGLGFPGSTGEPMKKGLNAFYGYNCQTLAHDYYPDHLWSNDTRVELPGNTKSDSVYSADLIHQQALRFLASQQQQPFFLFLPYTLPHAALYGPHDSLYQYYVKRFGEADVKEPAGPKKAEYRYEPQPHAAFAAMVARLDAYVGQIVQQVKRQGLEDNTLIIFTSDNGPHKEGGGDPVFFQSSGIYRGIKRDLYEGGIRVPFIANWPGKIQAGAESKSIGTFWDLFPTFTELAGIQDRSKYIDGISIVPLLYNKIQPVVHPYLYWEFHESGGRQAVRYGRWKGVRLNVNEKGEEAPIELYDIQLDPTEQHDVAGAHKDIVDKIRAFMKTSHVPDANWPLLATELKK